MTLQTDVVTLLRSPPVQKINFEAEGVKINGHVYSTLASKINWGMLHLVVDPSSLGQGTDAHYDYRNNTLTLKRSAFPDDYSKQVVLHELTHAAIDDMHLPARRGLHRTEGESIAFIAEHLYVRYINGRPPGANEWRIYKIADAIAKHIVKAAPRAYLVTHAEIRSLRNAIGQHRVYKDARGNRAGSDGIA